MRGKILLTTIIMSLMLVGCSSSLYEKKPSNYTYVTSVDGVSFSMPENFLEAATAITNISKDMDYSNSVYLYKNGETTYFLFDIDTAVIAVENKTTFDFPNSEDKLESLESNSLDGIWFNSEGKKLDYAAENKKNQYKLIATVDADVSITTDTYGTFVGKLAYVQTGNYECTMFVGYVGDKYDDLPKEKKEIIEHITKSLTLCENEEYYSSLESDTEENTEAATSTENAETGNITYNKESEAVDNIMDETEETATETIIVDDTEVTEKSDSPSKSSDKVTAASRLKKNQGVMVSDNQKELDDNSFSDIYHMLKIGETGYFNTFIYDDESHMINNVTIEELYTDDEAREIIKKYYETSNDAVDEYQEAPDGYSWHVVKYSLGTAPDKSYANIKVEGLDGNRLKYRGVSCTTRTYDIIYNWGTKTNLYCYYAVPNGCTEYILEVGDRKKTLEEGAYQTAFYYVSKF